jgi:CheY-like chemotaxis protein
MNDQLLTDPASTLPAAVPRRVQSAFIRNVHHELRTPLGVARGYTQLFNMGALGDLTTEQQQVMLIVDRRLADLQTIVERIEVLMTTEAHQSAAVPLLPIELLGSIMTRQRAVAEQAGLTFIFESDADLPLVYGDPQALAVALECLIENAVRFTPRGGQVNVRLYSQPGRVNFEITDTGIGIKPDQLTPVLNGFCQADDDDNRRYNGLGLGLAVVQTVVQRHAGQLMVTSEPGQGSQFTLQLPTIMTRATTMHPIPARSSQTDRPRRILLVDDELNQVSILRSGLAKLPDCQIVVATSGQQALELCAHQPFDLMITDYRMPEMDGLTLAALVRERYPATRIIMLTAFGNEILNEATEPGAVPLVLEKPIDMQHIREAALNALDSRQ